MENIPSGPTADLARAEALRSSLAASLTLPRGFHLWLGTAVAAQVASTAYGVSAGGAGTGVLVAGLAVFAGVAVSLLVRFRRLNGVRVDGLASRAVLGTSSVSSWTYAAALAAATWAAYGDRWWLSVLVSVAGGAAYALGAQHWWRSYVGDPAGKVRGESRLQLALLGAVAVAGLVALLVLR